MDKKRLSLIFVLLISVIACGLTDGNESLITTPEVQQAGFITGTPVDVASLPVLSAVGAGGEPEACFSESAVPSVSFGYYIFPYQSLCLNNFPTSPDSPGFTVSMVDPAGRIFSEPFSYSQNGILNSRGEEVGYIQSGAGIDGTPATPGVSIEVYLPASLACGDWTVSAGTQDGSINVAPTTLTVSCESPRISVLADLNTSPFVTPPDLSWEGPAFSDNETIYTVGGAYAPNTAITLAFYSKDPAAGTPPAGSLYLGSAKYAVSIMTDAAGNFQVPFIVGNATQRGAYYAIAAPVITDDIRLYYFGARFSIE
jgi:hypothetical protein